MRKKMRIVRSEEKVSKNTGERLPAPGRFPIHAVTATTTSTFSTGPASFGEATQIDIRAVLYRDVSERLAPPAEALSLPAEAATRQKKRKKTAKKSSDDKPLE